VIRETAPFASENPTSKNSDINDRVQSSGVKLD